MKKGTFPLIILLSFFLVSCASKPQIAYDPFKINDKKQFKADETSCLEIAKTYNLNGETAVKAVAGAAIGGTLVAGIATAVAGAVFPPAIPFIVGGALTGGGLWGNKMSKEESAAREKIFVQCMRDKGYEVYSAR